MLHRPRQSETLRIAERRQPLDLRSAGITQTEKLRRLVEGLADGVVHGVAKQDIVADAAHRHDLGMSAGCQKQAIREIHVIGQARGQRMGLEMVDRDQGGAVHQCQRLGGGQSDDYSTDQAGPRGGGNPVERVESALRFGHGLRDEEIQHLDMGAGGDLRHHATKGCMLVGLRQHDVRQYPSASVRIALHDRGCGLVTGGFDAQHDHRLAFPAGTRPYAGRTTRARSMEQRS